MSNGLGVSRLIVIAFGITLLVTGLVIIAIGGAGAFIFGFWTGAVGMALIVGALIERVRYRSDATERSGDPAGPAGGEPVGTRLDPRFRRSDEVFVDPTTGLRMRVWLDPGSGERRYLAED